MIDNGYMIAIGLPPDAEVAISSGRLAGITPPQPPLLTAIVAANCAGEFDNASDITRAIRAKLLALTDWTQAADSPLSDEQRAAWATYRQALRDLPSTYSGEGPIPWPAEPA